MTPPTPTAEPRHILGPVMHEGQPYCPRCNAMLRFDYDEYVCVACGYEYILGPRDLEIMRQTRRHLRRAAGIVALPLAAGPVSGSFALIAGLIALGVAAIVLTRRWRSSRPLAFLGGRIR